MIGIDTHKKEDQQSPPQADPIAVNYDDVHPSIRRQMMKGEAQKTAGKSDLIFYITLGVIVLIFASFFAVGYYKSHKRALTIDELHALNFEGKLDPDEGYIHNGVYSFIRQDDLWFTALQSASGRSLYSFAFRYSPKELADIPVSGRLDTARFNNATEYYITFNPTAENLSHTVLAVNDYNQHMLNVFQKTPIGACDRNVTEICASRPIITCENTGEVVVYIKDADTPSVRFDKNCITIFGRGFDQVKGVDRVLYQFYRIME